MSHVIELAPPATPLREQLFKITIDHLGDHIPNTVIETFAGLGITEDLIYNANFRRFSGGPKWLNPQKPDEACFRKYIGVRGLGDFSLVISHPKAALNYDDIVHSHADPARWLNDPSYASYTRYSSVRNPVGIINSSLFSINALTSEYIQRFVAPEDDNDELRQQLALYKFTDLEFFTGIARFYARYFTDFLPVRDQFHVMRWEDLITSPAQTIQAISQAAGVEVSADHAEEIWQRLDHVNLTGAHKHNYRKGKGKVGDWKNWMTNRHLQILRDHGFEEVTRTLGYGRIETLDETAYTPFQRRIDDMLRRGDVFNDYPDRDLFGFAFNKSNLDSSKFNFRRYDWKTSTQIERSSFGDEAIQERVWAAVDVAVNRVNRVLHTLLNGDYGSERSALAGLDEVRKAASDIGMFMPAAYQALFPVLEARVSHAFRSHPAGAGDPRPPRLIRAGTRHNLVTSRRRYFVVPHAAGPLDLDSQPVADIPGIVRTADWNTARRVFALLEEDAQSGERAENAGRGRVQFLDLFWGAPTDLNSETFSLSTLQNHRGIVAGSAMDEVAELLRDEPAIPAEPDNAQIAGADPGLHLTFVENSDDALVQAAGQLLDQGRVVALRPAGERARRIAERLGLALVTPATSEDEGVVSRARQGPPDAWLLVHSDGEAVADALLGFIDLAAGRVVAPITERHSSRMPLFLLSIPKAGTHLLFELARAMGYRDGGTAPLLPQGGHWYYVEYSNSHTVPKDFFIDTVRRSPFGNRMHPFMRCPALFIYRHPLDVLVSEAAYYHKPGNTSFAGYLSHLGDEARMLRLIDDPWLLGTLRDRVGQYAPWLECGNVVPVSFEELAGAEGGGNAATQHALIWSIQLKLQVGGTPSDFARHAFSTESPTFRSGQIGAHCTRLSEAARARVAALPADYMALFGYRDATQDSTGQFSRRIDEFRRRPLRLAPPSELPPILIESGYFGHSIVFFRNCFYAVPSAIGDIDLGGVGADALARLPHATDMAVLKQVIAAGNASPVVERRGAGATTSEASESVSPQPAGALLGYRLYRTGGHVIAVPPSALSDPAAVRFPPAVDGVIAGHARSEVMLHLLAIKAATWLRRTLAWRRPS